MNTLEDLLLPELKLIVIDYMGDEKRELCQLNYKKCIEEYRTEFGYTNYKGKLQLYKRIADCRVVNFYNYRNLVDTERDLSEYKIYNLYDIVADLPLNY